MRKNKIQIQIYLYFDLNSDDFINDGLIEMRYSLNCGEFNDFYLR